MNIRGEKSLEIRAKHNIGICCETLCDREPVEQYIKELETKPAIFEHITLKIKGPFVNKTVSIAETIQFVV